MMTTKLIHFLLVFDHGKGTLVREQEFLDSEEAVEAYFKMEEMRRDTPKIEIVLIGSDSLETVTLTHANCFDSSIGSSSKYLVGL